jgi:hypothetical protein
MQSNTPNAETVSVKAALYAASDRKEAAAKAAKAAPKAPAPDTDVLQAILAKLNALEAENAALKAGKAAPAKATKQPTITARNCTYTYDSGKLTIVFDLNADILDDSGSPRVSKSGETTGVAQFQGSFLDKKGRKVGVGCNAYHKLGK